MPVELSIITGTVDRPESVARLIQSIEQLTTVDYELIIADASKEPIKTKCPNVIILREWPRLGCVKGYNQAFRAAVGKWVMWLNDDVEVLAGYDKAAIRFMDMNSSIGLGAIYYSVNGGSFHVNSYLGMVYANFGIISRELGNKIHWFDPELEMYGNDNALAFCVLMQGKGVAPIPDSKVLHHYVDDDVRKGNQKNRLKDNLVLGQKYLRHRSIMERTYKAALASVKYESVHLQA